MMLTWNNGNLDDVLCFNRVLAANEVALLYSLGRGGWAQLRKLTELVEAAEPFTSEFVVGAGNNRRKERA